MQAVEGQLMNTQQLCARDRATLDRIVRPAQAVAEMVQAAVDEFLCSELCRRHIAQRVAEEDERCL